MAKKLIHDYILTSATDVVQIRGNIKGEQLLLITDVTGNQIIFNFSQSGKGFSARSYSSTTDYTSFTLDTDVSALGITDSTELQIFVDTDSQEIDFKQSFYDPVNKLRVSNPENLIDTDFEYGLQSSKWETLELVNNIPSYHSTTGDSSLSGIASITSQAGSDQITVTFNDPHRLTVGTPIDVRGLASVTAEGNFLITSVPTDETFIYKAKATQSATQNLFGSYTAIIAGRFFNGSQLDYNENDGIVSDQAGLSKLTVNTSYPHGFADGTEIYLLNTLGSRSSAITNTTGTAPDGDYYVEYRDTETTNKLSDFDMSQTVTRAVKGSYSFDFDPTSAVNTSNNRITITGHGLQSGWFVYYLAPQEDDEIGGLNRFDIYEVYVVDSNRINLRDTSGSTISLTSTGTANYGQHQIGLAYKLHSVSKSANSYNTIWSTEAQANSGVGSGSDLTTSGGLYGRSGNVRPQHLLFCARGSNTYGSTRGVLYYWGEGYNSNYHFPITAATASNDAVYRYFPFEASEKFYNSYYSAWGAESSYFQGNIQTTSTTGGKGDYQILTYYSSGFNYSTGYSHTFAADSYYVIPLIADPHKDSIYIANHGLSNGDEITFTTTSGHVELATSTSTGWNSNLPTISYSGSNATERINFIDANRVQFKKPLLRINGSMTALSAVGAKTTADSIYYANHGLSTGQTTTIGVANGGVLPTVPTGGIVYENADTHLMTMHQICQDGIEAWQTSNSSKYQNMTVGRSVRNFRTMEANTSSAFRYMSNDVYAGLSNDTRSRYREYAFGSAPDDTKLEALPTATNLFYDGYTAFKNLNTNGAEVPYTLMSHGADPIAAYQGSAQVPYMYTRQYRNSGSSTALYTQTNQTRNGYKYSCSVGVTPSTSTLTGNVSILLAIYKDAWASNNPSSTPSVQGNRNQVYSSYHYQFMSLPSYSANWYGAKINMEIPANVTWSSTDAQNLINSILDQFNTDFVYPTLTNGTNVGVTVLNNNRFKIYDPTSLVAFDFSNSGTPDITVSSITATGTSYGELDGTYPVYDSPSTTSYRLQLPFSAPQRTITFESADVSISDDTLSLTGHGFVTGMPFEYSQSGTAVGGLTSGTTYYAIVINEDLIQVATSSADATAGIEKDLTATGSNTGHSLLVDSVAGMTPQAGVISTTSGSAIITGDEESLFKRYWKTGDPIIIKNTTTTPPSLVESTVKIIPTDGKIELESTLDFTSTTSKVFRKTELYVRPNGLFQHKPFDGGVAIQTGTSPNSSLVRQTRKYFRYQSGKGIQTSYAMNFNPPVQAETVSGTGTTATITTRYPHRLSVGNSIEIIGSEDANYNGNYSVATVPDDFTFTYTAGGTLTPSPSGFVDVYLNSYTDSFVRGGMFDEQNGFFYEFDGQDIYCVRRSSTQQLSGTFAVTNKGHSVTGTSSSVSSQISAGDMVVIRGQSYKVTSVTGATNFTIVPRYRGVDATGVIVTKTVDTKVAQSNWSIDPCDGTGASGFNLDLKKIQMAYMDYAWYGAGKIRFGWKDNDGKVIYTHAFIHNNRLKESYFRSGNLPARYEVGTTTAPQYYPALFHWGTSVIMDGRFDDDKAYLFTSNSNTLTFSNGLLVTANTTEASFLSSEYNFSTRNRDWYVNIPFATGDASKLITGTPMFTTGGELSGEVIHSTKYQKIGGTNRIIARVFVTSDWSTPQSGTYPAVNAATSVSFGASQAGTSEVDLGTALIPLISIRLAPSVDGGLSGGLGQRDIINRMHLKLNTIGVVLTHDCEVSLILNSDLSTTNFESVQSPSLCQTIKHEIGQEIIGGSNLFQFRASGGTEDSAGQNTSTTSNFELGEIIDLGNSILGGDGVFPNGPDILTIAVKILNSSGVSATNQFQASARISWAESQA